MAYSAGSQPKGAVHPQALALLERLGYPTDGGLRSKSWDEFAAPGAPVLDFVFTVCDNAANEVCPVWPGQPMTAHWGVPDPAAVQGSEAEIAKAFRDTFLHAAAAHRIVRQSSGAQPRPHVAQEAAGRDRRTGSVRGAEGVIGANSLPKALGTAFLLAAVVGSGIMGERLAGGNVAIALLANTIATGAALAVLISIFGPVSGAHFNPAVTLFFALRREIAAAGTYRPTSLSYRSQARSPGVSGRARDVCDADPRSVGEAARRPGAMVGGVRRHLRLHAHHRRRGTSRARRRSLPRRPLYITAAYWFTASTSFANPAVTIARALTDSFAGIAPHSVPGFIAAQFVAAVAGWITAQWLFESGAIRVEIHG